MTDRRDLSRRAFLAASAGMLAAGAVGRGAAAQGRPAARPPAGPAWTPVFAPIRGNVGDFTGRGGTIGFLVNAGGVAVVDTQYPDAAKVFLEGLNTRSGNRTVDVVFNTHHHIDHTGGNPVLRPMAKTIVAQANVPALQKQANEQAATPTEQVYADYTFTDRWDVSIGDETIHAATFTPAHTGGDAVMYFEHANVVHVGDLVWNGLQTFVDRPGGASAINWITVTERIAEAYPGDAIYVWGHSAAKLPVTGSRANVLEMRNYLTALVEFVRAGIKAGKARAEIVGATDLLPGFEARGPLTGRALEGTYDEVIETG
jgi:cyclase